MSRAVPRPSAEERFRSLVDGLIESWVCWREACEEVRRAAPRPLAVLPVESSIPPETTSAEWRYRKLAA